MGVGRQFIDVSPLHKANCLLWLAIDGELNFGKTIGLELPPSMSLIPICVLLQLQRRLG